MTHHTAEPPRPAGVRGWLLKDLPYAAMLGLAVGGIVLTSFRGVSTHYYWMALAPIYGLISIISGWPKLDTGPERMKLVVPSRPGELHPESLTDPDVILSHHPARATMRRLPPSIDDQVPPAAG